MDTDAGVKGGSVWKYAKGKCGLVNISLHDIHFVAFCRHSISSSARKQVLMPNEINAFHSF